MKKFIFLFPAMLMLAAAGCTAPFEETVSPADITVEQLESRMKQAMDPKGQRVKLNDSHFIPVLGFGTAVPKE